MARKWDACQRESGYHAQVLSASSGAKALPGMARRVFRGLRREGSTGPVAGQKGKVTRETQGFPCWGSPCRPSRWCWRSAAVSPSTMTSAGRVKLSPACTGGPHGPLNPPPAGLFAGNWLNVDDRIGFAALGCEGLRLAKSQEQYHTWVIAFVPAMSGEGGSRRAGVGCRRKDK